jgi:hypothetical protein
MKCKLCQLDKQDSEFYIPNKNTGTLDSTCKECRKEKSKKYRESHKIENQKYFKSLRENNKDKMQEKDHEYYVRNKNSIIKRTTNYRKQHLAEYRIYSKKNSRTEKTRYRIAAAQAKRREKEFKLSFEEYKSAISLPCYYCNYQIGVPVEKSVGLDRLDNSIGYEIGNVVSCCAACNNIRNNTLSPEETKAAVQLVLIMRNQPEAANSILQQILNLHEKGG